MLMELFNLPYQFDTSQDANTPKFVLLLIFVYFNNLLR